ncbi:MAG: hypothetical protein HKN74_12855 [Acidimicrobiia bacterium]|nr:hypothetical protein [Acidimicrobiia bacterium]MBT8217155.1 hypothetical protein [Acidimicrobiia bacterium]NNF11163.1 hypothetical protein [Acidimicrobiia bacterium]NNL69333.1 hypothetical protein [Acidimicrobiia bacterium]
MEDPLDELGRELRERMGDELRAEAELVEQDAATVELRRRTVADVALELVSRGDTVSVIAGEKVLRGTLVYARGELARIHTASGRADINLASPVVLRVDARSRDGGTAARPGADTLRARLLEYDMEDVAIELWAPTPATTVSGSISAVGRDHVVLEDHDGADWIVRLVDIAWIVPG